LVQIHAKGYQFNIQTFQIKICTICVYIMLPLIIKIKHIYQCEDADRVYAVFRTSLWATHVVRTGDLVPTDTMLVTPGLDLVCYYQV